jgi:hypothetical protein
MELETLAAERSVEKIVLQYYRGLDRKDRDLVRECFHPDAAADYSPYFKGDREELLDYLFGPDALAGFEQTLHHPSVVVAEVDGEAAQTETYCIAHHVALEPHPWAGAFVVVWLRYLDSLALRDGRWGIVRRRVIVEFMRRDEAGGFLEVPPEARGRRDREDPSYER